MRRARIDLRVRVDEKEAWERAAERYGLKLSELIRRGTWDYIADHDRNFRLDLVGTTTSTATANIGYRFDPDFDDAA